ncbi:MAG: biotin transporter BioY [Bacteroidota bacterium]
MNLTAPPTSVSLKGSSSILAQVLWIMSFALATAVGARVEIPHLPVPYTLQTFVVLLAGAFLGARNGAISQLVYIGAGAIGLPVFAGGALGMVTLIGPTGGYLLAFPAAAALVGMLIQYERNSYLWHVVTMATGLAVIFVSGALQLYALLLHDAGKAISAGLLIFSWWDGLKLLAAAAIYHEFAKRWPRLPQ